MSWICLLVAWPHGTAQRAGWIVSRALYSGKEGKSSCLLAPSTVSPQKVYFPDPCRLCVSKHLAGPHLVPCLCVCGASAPSGSWSMAQAWSHHSHCYRRQLRPRGCEAIGVWYAQRPSRGNKSSMQGSLRNRCLKIELPYYNILLTNLL